MSGAPAKRSGPNLWILVAGVVLIAPMLLLFNASFGNDPRAVPFLMEGQPAPEFSLQTLDGDTITLKSLRGKPAIINFWSTWCGPCKQEHPVLLRAPQRYPGVTFLGVVYQDEPDKVRSYLRAVGGSYQHLIDPNGHTAVLYGVAGVPETYFIDANGVIIYKQIGPVDDRMLQQLVTQMLGVQ